MEEIIRRRDITDEEKVKLYEDTLAQFITYRNKVIHPVTTEHPPQPLIPEKQFIDDVLASVPKALRGKAEQLTRTVLREMTWSPKGELIVNGETFRGTHIVDLVNNAVRQRKSFRPEGRDKFLQELARLNIPRELIGNHEIWKIWYPSTEEEDQTSHPVHHTPMSIETMVNHAERQRQPAKTPRQRPKTQRQISSRWLQYNDI